MAEKKNVMDAAAPVEVDKVTGEVKENQMSGIFTVGNVKKQTMEVANDDQVCQCQDQDRRRSDCKEEIILEGASGAQSKH